MARLHLPLVGLAAAVAVTLAAGRADAHAIGLSQGDYTTHGTSLDVRLAFARGEIAGVLPSLDADHDGHISAFEVQSARKDLETKVLARIHVTEAGAACTPVLTSAALTENDGLALDGRFACATRNSGDAPFEVDVALLDDLSHGHRHVARAVGATTHDEVLYKGHASLTIAPPVGPTSTAPAAAASSDSTHAGGTATAWAFFVMGIEHILTGYDHLVFLFGLVLLRARLKELLAVVTAFTVAHSITLAIAVLGIFTPSPRIVEPAIALSIAYVGIENLFVKDGSKRWRITFPFGLIHGFGFAAALQQINLPHAQVPTALVCFNLGVEAGQLCTMALVLPLVMLIRKKEWFEPNGVRILSGAVAIAGGLWFVLRVAS